MKYQYVAACLVMAISCQLALGQGLGVRGGVMISQQDHQETGFDFTTDSKVGLDLAIFYDAAIGHNIALQPELHYIQKGTSINAFFGGQDLDSRLDYLEFSLLLKLALIGDSNGLSIGPFVGPSAGIAVNGKRNDVEIDFDEDDLKRLDYGVHVGAMLKLPLGNLAMFADVRYYFGIADISHVSTKEITNQGVGVGAGIIF